MSSFDSYFTSLAPVRLRQSSDAPEAFRERTCPDAGLASIFGGSEPPGFICKPGEAQRSNSEKETIRSAKVAYETTHSPRTRSLAGGKFGPALRCADNRQLE